MYDELVKALRNMSKMGTKYGMAVVKMREAADAIEDLEFACNHYEKDYKALCAYLPKWIPVTERLPTHEYGESASVLTIDLYGVMRVVYFDGGNWCWPSGEALTTMRVAPITHWMPLPLPPREE